MTPFYWPRMTAALLSLGAAGLCGAQSSAVRYFDQQGVEVIVNRDAARDKPAQTDTPDNAARAVKPAGRSGQSGLQNTGLALDPRLHISADEQKRRDRDRVGILQQELDFEAQAYAGLMKRAQGSPGAEKPSAAQTQRLNEELYDHQQNIQSLTAELRRARSTQ